MKIKRLLSFVASAAMTISALFGAMSITASADYNGTAGDLSWNLYTTGENNGLLEITVTSQEPDATAAMADYTATNAPWYSRRSNVKKIKIGEGVTNIGTYAFSSYTTVTEVTLPSTITSIGDYAFNGCSGLTTITLSETAPKITTFGDHAFYNCSNLQNAPEDLLTSATTINGYAFYGCSRAFTEVTANSVTTLGERAFYGCTSMTSISINSMRLKTISTYAFNGCSNLASVTFHRSGPTEIADYAFQNCSSLTTISLSRIQKLGTQAFYNCKMLSNVTLPSSPTSLGRNIFEDCVALETISIPSGFTELSQSMFQDCTSLNKVTFEGNSLTTIGDSAFSNCPALESITIPGSVKTIGNSAFNKCNQLAEVTLTPGIKEIGKSAFSDCAALKSINLPNSLTTLGTGVFNNCGTLDKIMIPAAVTSIPDSTFSGCAKLSSVDLPDTVASIGANAFKDCTSLASITLPNKLTSVTGEAFVGCTSLKEIKVNPENEAFSNPTSSSYSGILLNKDKSVLVAYPMGMSTSISLSSVASSIKEIGDYAFYNNTKISSVTFPNSSFKSIGNYAFTGCTSLSSINIYGNDFVNIGNYAFDGCTRMSSFSGLSNENLVIGNYAFRSTSISYIASVECKSIGNYAFAECASLTTFTFSSNNSVTSIGNLAFQNCVKLKKITIPDTVTSLGKSVFSGCSVLSTVILSKNLTLLDNFTFQDCTSLKKVDIPNSVTELGQNVFYGSAVEEISVPNSVTTLGTNVFQKCASLKKAVISNQVTSLPSGAFSGCTNENLEIYLLGTLGTVNNDAFGNNASTYVKGTVYVYDDTSYTKASNASAFNNGTATIAYGANFTELKKVIEEAKSLYEIDYSNDSYSVVASALNLAEIIASNYMSPQGSADIAASGLRNAIDKLVVADNSELLAKVAEVAKEAEENYVRSDYKAHLYDDLRTAYRAGQNVTGEERNSELQKLIDDIHKAEDNLFVAYAYPDPVITVKSGTGPDGTNYSTAFGYNIPAMSGIATADVAGATKAKITFDCASYVSFNNNTKFNFHSVITRPTDEDPFYRIIDDNSAGKVAIGNSWATGTTGNVLTFDLVEPLQEGDAYNIYTYTYSWANYTDYNCEVFYIREVELLNAEGETVLSTKDVIVPNEELKAAVEKANTVDTTNAPADKAQALQDAIDAGEAILEEELPLPSAMEAAVTAIQDAIDALSEPSVDTKALDEAIKNAEEMDTSAYTDESVAVLTEAIKNAKDVLANGSATQEDVEAAEKAISDAIAALAKKPSDSSDPSDPSNPSDSSNVGPSTPTVTEPTTADPAVRAAKDKADAQKLMNQAKITKLTVKSKAKKKITVTWKKVSKAKGYQVQVSKKNKFNKKNIILNKLTSKKKLTVTKKIKSGKTYYVRVRAYATYKDANNVTKKVYSKWIKKLRKVKVK